MKFGKPKFPKKSDEDIEKEMRNIITGKDKSLRGRMLKQGMTAIMIKDGIGTEEVIKLMVAEYKQKYSDLCSGKKTLDDIKKESLRDVEEAKRFT
jgi:hypothetical protein